jgi:hypothetical protein
LPTKKQNEIHLWRRHKAEKWLDLSALPNEQSNVFSYLAAVVNGKIKPEKDLSSFAVNSVVVEILSAAKESAKTGKTIYFSR